MRKILLAVIASAGTLAFGGAAGAATVVSGSFTLDDSQFGAQTGVHGDGAENTPANTLFGHINQEGSAVTFTSTDLISWTGGQGEAIIEGDPSFDNLLVTFAHGWGQITFDFEDPTTSMSVFNLSVNGGAGVFSNPGNCSFCTVGNGSNKFTISGPNITTLSFSFDPAIDTAKQFRVLLPCTEAGCSPGGIPEPATWAMMIVGFGGVGALLRRRRQGLLRAA